jgi:hypothetical protein
VHARRGLLRVVGTTRGRGARVTLYELERDAVAPVLAELAERVQAATRALEVNGRGRGSLT